MSNHNVEGKRRSRLKTVVFCVCLIAIVLTCKPALDWTLVSFAARGNTRGIEMLLRLGADPNTRHADPGYALLQAAYFDHNSAVRALLTAGANPKLRLEGGVTALMYAARHGSADTVKSLLAAGADPNQMDGIGRTALTFAEGRSDIIHLLRMAGARS